MLLSFQDPLTSRLLNRATPTLASVAGTSTFTSTPASRSVPLGPTIPLGPSAPLASSIPPAPTVTSNSTVVSSAKTTTVPGRSGQRVFLLLLVVGNHLQISCLRQGIALLVWINCSEQVGMVMKAVRPFFLMFLWIWRCTTFNTSLSFWSYQPITAARLAQVGEHWSAQWEVVGSNLSQTNNQGFF